MGRIQTAASIIIEVVTTRKPLAAHHLDGEATVSVQHHEE
jgi:hypothetical protein